jgi:hypothetical protein
MATVMAMDTATVMAMADQETNISISHPKRNVNSVKTSNVSSHSYASFSKRNSSDER